MRTPCVVDMIAKAKVSKSPFATAINASTEVGIVVPSILKTNLEKSGFKIVTTSLKMTAKVEVFNDKGVLVAQGRSHDAGDALLQAIYAEIK